MSRREVSQIGQIRLVESYVIETRSQGLIDLIGHTIASIMSSPLPHNVYREQLASLYLGHALWDPDPSDFYEKVSVGDVGFMINGLFFRMFNVRLPWDHPSNRLLGEPDPYKPLDLGPFPNIRVSKLSRRDYYSPHVNARV